MLFLWLCAPYCILNQRKVESCSVVATDYAQVFMRGKNNIIQFPQTQRCDGIEFQYPIAQASTLFSTTLKHHQFRSHQTPVAFFDFLGSFPSCDFFAASACISSKVMLCFSYLTICSLLLASSGFHSCFVTASFLLSSIRSSISGRSLSFAMS